MKRVIVICIFVFSILWLYATDYVAISEVMYDTPFNENTSTYPHCIGEYIELYNAHDQSVDLSNWSLHTFSPNQSFLQNSLREPLHSAVLSDLRPADIPKKHHQKIRLPVLRECWTVRTTYPAFLA